MDKLKAILQTINEVSYEHSNDTEMLVSIDTLLTLKREIERLDILLETKDKLLKDCRIARDNAVSQLINKSKYIRFDKRI